MYNYKTKNRENEEELRNSGIVLSRESEKELQNNDIVLISGFLVVFGLTLLLVSWIINKII